MFDKTCLSYKITHTRKDLIILSNQDIFLILIFGMLAKDYSMKNRDNIGRKKNTRDWIKLPHRSLRVVKSLYKLMLLKAIDSS